MWLREKQKHIVRSHARSPRVTYKTAQLCLPVMTLLAAMLLILSFLDDFGDGVWGSSSSSMGVGERSERAGESDGESKSEGELLVIWFGVLTSSADCLVRCGVKARDMRPSASVTSSTALKSLSAVIAVKIDFALSTYRTRSRARGVDEKL